jgi:hypothetical protein
MDQRKPAMGVISDNRDMLRPVGPTHQNDIPRPLVFDRIAELGRHGFSEAVPIWGAPIGSPVDRIAPCGL